MNKFTLGLLLVLLWGGLTAQHVHSDGRTCAAMEVLEQDAMQDPDLLGRMEAIEAHTRAFVNGSVPSYRSVITIPVVVHVVYRNATENISDAQVLSQIQVLNNDFRRLNADAANTPSAFASLVADSEINFCLAQRDPNGNPTTGIMRYASNRTSDWGTNNAVKNPSQGGVAPWNASQYLNIWVCAIGGGILGYAQFPGGSASTDGVVVDYRYFGTMGTAVAPFNQGRTATHEVGHWLNLRHIWGDATCGSDQVSDTPVHNAANYGCPSFPHYSTCTGTPLEMTMNYMDYTDDACMYMFSEGQKARMRALFASGGARASLLTSQGCVPPSTCGTPAPSASGVTSTAATISWAAVAGASAYNLQFKTAAATTWTTVGGITSTSRTLTGLVAGTTYNFQVQAVCSSASGPYSAAGSFTTTANATCGTPAPSASGVTSTTATISWAAITGATSYNLQFKTAAATTWTTVGGITTTSHTLSGLVAGTAYNFQVQAVCSGTNSSYSAVGNFTTTAASSCTDTYEPNENRTAAKNIAVNTNIVARIGASNDRDWFRFSNTAAAPRIRITLTNLPADYDVILYNSSGTQIGISQNGGTASETIVFNTTTVGTYFVQVYGYNGAFNTSVCYNLRADISNTSFRMEEGAVLVEDDWAGTAATSFKMYPNPAGQAITLDVQVEQETPTRIVLSDCMGRVVTTEQRTLTKGDSRTQLDVSGLPNGVYVVSVQNGESISSQRLVIQH